MRRFEITGEQIIVKESGFLHYLLVLLVCLEYLFLHETKLLASLHIVFVDV